MTKIKNRCYEEGSLDVVLGKGQLVDVKKNEIRDFQHHINKLKWIKDITVKTDTVKFLENIVNLYYNCSSTLSLKSK